MSEPTQQHVPYTHTLEEMVQFPAAGSVSESAPFPSAAQGLDCTTRFLPSMVSLQNSCPVSSQPFTQRDVEQMLLVSAGGFSEHPCVSRNGYSTSSLCFFFSQQVLSMIINAAYKPGRVLRELQLVEDPHWNFQEETLKAK